MPPKPLVHWRFLDGRPGHENQVLGLSEALSMASPSVLVDVPVGAKQRGYRAFLPGKFRHLSDEPKPHLLIGAGHATHAALIRCRQLFGGRSVVMMKPSLPSFLFDLCLIPRHDRLLPVWPNVVRTAGAVNRMRPSGARRGGCGVLLIGGPSRHFHWSDELVRAGILRFVSATSQQWTVATSRRTPASLLENWQDRPNSVVWRTAEELGAIELAELMGTADRVAVTSDSMSMICEALTSGADVDLIMLPPRGSSRMASEVQSLVRNGLFSVSSQQREQAGVVGLTAPGNPAHRTAIPEADRCAELVLERLCPERPGADVSASSEQHVDGNSPVATILSGVRLWTAMQRAFAAIAGGGFSAALLRDGEQ